MHQGETADANQPLQIVLARRLRCAVRMARDTDRCGGFVRHHVGNWVCSWLSHQYVGRNE
jgi:hypothetical protein